MITCVEASPLFSIYIPCGAPATCVVISERGKALYPMCTGCAEHNVARRGAEYFLAGTMNLTCPKCARTFATAPELSGILCMCGQAFDPTTGAPRSGRAGNYQTPTRYGSVLGPVHLITGHDPPPIPTRDCDWFAYDDNLGADWFTAYGATEQEAIAELMERIEANRLPFTSSPTTAIGPTVSRKRDGK